LIVSFLPHQVSFLPVKTDREKSLPPHRLPLPIYKRFCSMLAAIKTIGCPRAFFCAAKSVDNFQTEPTVALAFQVDLALSAIALVRLDDQG
jgi:hypothetical protein